MITKLQKNEHRLVHLDDAAPPPQALGMPDVKSATSPSWQEKPADSEAETLDTSKAVSDTHSAKKKKKKSKAKYGDPLLVLVGGS